MSTFAVFGLTLSALMPKAEAQAYHAVMRRYASTKAKPESQTAMMREVADLAAIKAAAYMDMARPIQLSAWLDSPQFCMELIDCIARSGLTAKGLHIRQRTLELINGKATTVIQPYVVECA